MIKTEYNDRRDYRTEGFGMDTLLRTLQADGIEIRESCMLASHSTFRVGGAARAVAFPDTRERLLGVLRKIQSANVRFAVFGNGSNVVFSDAGFDGLVIFTGKCREIVCDGNRIHAACGASLAQIASTAYANSLSGAEFMHGIPGTLGGAIFMNAGAFDGCMADVTVSSEYWDAETGDCKTITGDLHQFAYRTSIYEKHPSYILLGATLTFTPSEQSAIRAKMDDYMVRRRRTQPLEYPSAGSAFKRPVGHFAGKLIEDCGLKGYTVGGAQVSQKHAGFIVNVGGATAENIRALVEDIQRVVLQKTGVLLECELRFIDP